MFPTLSEKIKGEAIVVAIILAVRKTHERFFHNAMAILLHKTILFKIHHVFDEDESSG